MKPKRTAETFRTSAGKVTVESRRGVDAQVVRAALAEVMAQLDARESEAA